jgi:putative RecB family exonuclease
MDHLSSSQINLYLQCSLKYKFQYVDQLPKPFKASGLVFGSAIHAVLGWFHKEGLNGRTPSLDQLYRIFEADWYGQTVESEIRYKQEESEASLMILGKGIIGLYYREPLDGVHGIEIPFTVPLLSPITGEALGINLEGFIDLLKEDGTIVEFKTSFKAMDLKDLMVQLSACGYAYWILHRRPPRLFKVVNFIKTKRPRMLVLEASQCDHGRFFFLAKQVWAGIRAQVFFPRQSFMCSGCEYAEPCRTWQGV